MLPGVELGAFESCGGEHKAPIKAHTRLFFNDVFLQCRNKGDHFGF